MRRMIRATAVAVCLVGVSLDRPVPAIATVTDPSSGPSHPAPTS